MNLGAAHDIADDGTTVQSDVHLSIEDVGIVELPFRVQVRVNHVRLFTAHTATEAEAKKTWKDMHAAYLETHSSAA